jgi:hypothetical protein
MPTKTTVRSQKNRYRRQWFIVPATLLTLTIIVCAVIGNGIARNFTSALEPTTDISKYEELLHDYSSELTQHFPDHIPENATQVRFYYLPAFMQGGSFLQLRCKLPLGEVNALLTRYRPIARQVGTSAQIQASAKIPLTSFEGQTNLASDFQILILGGEPGKTNPVDWNHGYTYGLAISIQRQEVIYYADYW